jgi:hypothetical protein
MILGGIALVGFASCFATNEINDGGFRQMEWQLRFVDKDGRPIPGVQLTVLDNQGKIAFGYPVTDYLVNAVPTSNEDGLMVFHHVALGMEFSWGTRYLFFFIPIDTNKPPVYWLVFRASGRTVGTFRYNDYFGVNPDGRLVPVVKKAWIPCGPSPFDLSDHLRLENRKLPATLDFVLVSKQIVID